MPNWTGNTVEITGPQKDIKALKEALYSKEDDNVFDFNAIIPMPEELFIEEGSMTETAMVCFLSDRGKKSYYALDNEWGKVLYDSQPCYFSTHDQRFEEMRASLSERTKENIDELFDLGRQYVYNLVQYGATTWYYWAIKNWGTKWNACSAQLYDESDTSLSYAFDTAWSPPDPVIMALAEKWPTCRIYHESIQEEDYSTYYTSTYECGCLIDQGQRENEDYEEYDEEDE